MHTPLIPSQPIVKSPSVPPVAQPAPRWGDWSESEPSSPPRPLPPLQLRPVSDEVADEIASQLLSLYCPRRGFGPARLSEDEWRGALGHGLCGRIAEEVWSVDASHRHKKKRGDGQRRNASMYVWTTRGTTAKEIADYFGVVRSDRQIEKARARLYRVGLERILRSKPRRRAEDGSRYSELVVREVYGKMWFDPSRKQWVVGVPEKVAAKIRSAPRHGGRRVNSGRMEKFDPRRELAPSHRFSSGVTTCPGTPPIRTVGENQAGSLRTTVPSTSQGLMPSANAEGIDRFAVESSLKAKQPAVPSPPSPALDFSPEGRTGAAAPSAATPAKPAAPAVTDPPAATISAEDAAWSALVEAAQGKRSIGSVPVTPTDGIDWRIRGVLQLRPGATFAEIASFSGLDYATVYDEIGRAMEARLVRWAKVDGEKQKRWWLK